MEENHNTENTQVKIQVISDGPYLLEGTIIIVDKDGTENIKEGKTALCRCGASKNKPFCDGSHKGIEFDK